MAAIMMTPSRFGSSHSGTQSGFAASAPSMVDSLPAIDFKFNELRERMAHFTARFDDFIEQGRKRVLEERNAFRMNVAELEDQQRQRSQNISALQSKTSSHAHALSKEAQEKEEMQEAIRSLTAQREEHLSHRDQTKAEVAATQAAIRQRRDAQAAHQRSLDAQARHNIPELHFWETSLAMRIEGTGIKDTIRFVFNCVDERDPERDCWIDLHIGGRDFEIVNTKPRLDREGIDEVQERFNENRTLGGLLKSMRGMFVDAVKL